jgi:hypothetical protein
MSPGVSPLAMALLATFFFKEGSVEPWVSGLVLTWAHRLFYGALSAILCLLDVQSRVRKAKAEPKRPLLVR